jgi:imidazolonepropionase-like amidohydrolase
MTRVLFTGGLVYDGTSAAPAAGDVVVEGGRIVAIGTGLDGDEVVDTSGGTLCPGFLDCHVHVTVTHLDNSKYHARPRSYRAYQTVGNLRRTLAGGITTARDAGGADLGVKQAVADGLVPGPRLHISIAMLSQTAGHGDPWEHSGCGAPGLVDTGDFNAVVDGADNLRQAVRDLARRGADCVKVAASGGVLSSRTDPHAAHYTPDELAAVTSEAARFRMAVLAHAVAADGILQAVKAGVDSIDHGIYLTPEIVDLMVERGTRLVPTLVAPRGVLTAADEGQQIDPNTLAKARAAAEAHEASFRLAVEAGVEIAMGTDAGVHPHGRNLDELELMVAGGLSPVEALRATTSNAARLMRLGDDTGRVAEGYRADLVLVDGDATEVKGLPDRILGVWQSEHGRLS